MSSATDPLFDEEDLSNPDFRCVHGTFIGNPYGADYMCGWCEDGISYEDYVAAMTAQANRQRRRNTTYKWIEQVQIMPDPPMYVIKMFTNLYRAMLGDSAGMW